MKLPTSFVWRLIGHQNMLHVDSKLRNNGKFSSDGGILGVDFNWAKSINKAYENKIIPQMFGSRNDGVRVNEENITSRINAETGNAFIPWCNGQVIRGHGRGVLVKFDGFRWDLTKIAQ